MSKLLWNNLQRHLQKGATTPSFKAGIIGLQRNQHTAAASNEYDLVVVGGGIVGMASAREILLRHPELKVAVLEKEHKLAMHQSGHNSGVIHAGIYYKPGSLKAKLCVEGMHLMYAYLDEKKIPYKKCGKLIVATDELEVQRLMDLRDRAIKNGVPDLQLINESQIPDFEPYCRGVKALLSPYTGIVDFAMVTERYGQDFKQAGGDVFVDFKVKKFSESEDSVNAAEYPITIRGSKDYQLIKARNVLTCGGLQSDILAEMTGCSRSPRIVPFRGEYLLLSEQKQHMVKGNIYPVPDPRFPFLGVHFTPRMNGEVWLGPNAVLAFKREGYKWSQINLLELADAIRFSGFRKMAGRYMVYGLGEVAKSAFIPLQIKELQKFIPDILEYDVGRGPTGVRAQAIDMSGNLVDDFVFDRGDGKDALSNCILHCRNAPSPGATSSLAIAKMVADKIEHEFKISNTRTRATCP